MSRNQIEMIAIEKLEHHPDNPRKDLGDLSELTESIRANGILQNLTVVFEPGHNMTPEEWQTCAHEYETGKATEELRRRMNEKKIPDRYLVVIGNRRMEAAKAAGLVELPCVISDMDHRTQVATMLMENMQRTDLTPYEQAEGFQMMMDLGFKEKEIGEKTGFSTKTVKDRLKLAKLNKKEFTKAIERGANLIDMIEVTKLESKTAQNEVLAAAGTENFRQRMQSALRDQEFEKAKKRLVPVLKEAGVEEIPQTERYNGKWENMYNVTFDMKKSEDELRKHLKKIMSKPDLQYRYEMDNYYSGAKISFYHSKEKPGPMSDEQKTERQKALARGKRLRKVKGFWAQAYDLRLDFVKNYTVANGQSASMIGKILIRYALNGKPDWQGKIEDSHKWKDAYLRAAFDLPEKPVELPNEDPETASWKKNYRTIWDQVEGKSVPVVRLMIAWALGGGVFWPDDPEHGMYKFEDGTYQKNSGCVNDLDRVYEFLVEIGYQLSDMEKQLLDGSHPCYQEGAGL